jgi:hypothetical protein
MNSETPTHQSVARGALAVLYFFAILWTVGVGFFFLFVPGNTVNLVHTFPLPLVVLLHIALIWVRSTIISAISEGLAIGFSLQNAKQHFARPAKNETLQ